MTDDGYDAGQLELVPRAGFPLEIGDTVRFVRPRGGFSAGYFQGWTATGKAVVRPEGTDRVRHVPAKALRPSNDGRMLQRRGRFEYAPPVPPR